MTRAFLPRRLSRDQGGITVEFAALDISDLPEAFLSHSFDRQGCTDQRTVRIDRAELARSTDAGPLTAGLIFHVGRCGSSLLCQAMKPTQIVLGEPDVFGHLFWPPYGDWTSAELHGAARLLLRWYREALPHPPVVKLSSWLSWFHREIGAYTEKQLFLFRDPLPVAYSMIEQPPAWLAERNGDNNQHIAQLIGSFLAQGLAMDKTLSRLLRYEWLSSGRSWREAFDHFQVKAGYPPPNASVWQINAKDPKRIERFTKRAPAPQPTLIHLRDQLDRHAMSNYERLLSRVGEAA